MGTARIVRKHREAMGLTQAQLAARAGVSKPTVENIEMGKHQPEVETARRLAAVFQIVWTELFE